jgi:regulator of protease activity HflC (stomatin/prohibitin superfamily)
MKVALWWRVTDLAKYYYLIDREVRVMDERLHPSGLLNALPADGPTDAAEKWMLTLAESSIRKLVSQSTTALIVSKTATSYLHVEGQHQPLLPGVPEGRDVASPDVLALEIHAMLAPKADEYGLGIDRVEIQEVRLPKDIQEAVDNVFKATLQPAQSEQEAKAQAIKLRSAASVLGVEAVALQEVMKSFKGSQFIGGMPRFIEALFAKSGSNRLDQGDERRKKLPKKNET